MFGRYEQAVTRWSRLSQPGGHPRPGSDVDLSLVVRWGTLPAEEPAREALLRAVLATTLDSWRGPVECDLAAIYRRQPEMIVFAAVIEWFPTIQR